MNVKIKGIKRFFRDLIKVVLTRRYRISLKHIHNKHYYIIRRNPPWAGFFSNYLYVAAHMEYALKKGYIPVIDMQNFPTLYNEDVMFMGTLNSWEYYFEQPMGISIEEAYKSNNYILSDISTMHKYLPYYEDRNVYRIDWHKGSILSEHIHEYFRIKDNVKEVCEPFLREKILGKRILGVHYRGTDKKVQVKEHFLAAKLDNYIAATRKCLENHTVDGILLCTDETNAIERFEAEFPGMIIHSEAFRADENGTEGIHLMKGVNRENHKYLLGLEVLCDMIYLSHCEYFVFSHSNVANAALIVNNDKYVETFLVEE